MGRRATTPPPPQPPKLTVDQLGHCIKKLQKCVQELEAFAPEKVQKRYNITEVVVLETSIKEALGAAFGHGTVRYNLYKDAADLDQGPPPSLYIAPAFDYSPAPNYDDVDAIDARRYLTEGKERSIRLLLKAIGALEDDIAERTASAPLPTPKARRLPSNKVFVVHGHDEAALQTVARFLEQLGLEAIILREQPDRGRTIIEKFVECADDVGFAVVLLTPDDVAGPAAAPGSATRARQNVIFELGYFAGALGRGRVCLLRRGDVEIPSDLYGVIYTNLDDGDGWKLKLAGELKAAKLDFDVNRMWQ